MPRSQSRSPHHRKHRDHPKSYALPDKRDSDRIIENGRKHKNGNRRRKSSDMRMRSSSSANSSPAESGEMRDSDIIDDIRDQDLMEIEKQVTETRKRNVDQKVEEERLIRQKWAEEKRIKEEVTRRFEYYIQSQVTEMLKSNEEEVDNIIKERVANEWLKIEKERKEAEEIRKEIEKKERQRKLDEELRIRAELEALEKERQLLIEENHRRQEEEKAKKLADELRILEDRQRREAEDKRQKKREQDLILNKNKSRAKLSFSFMK